MPPRELPAQLSQIPKVALRELMLEGTATSSQQRLLDRSTRPLRTEKNVRDAWTELLFCLLAGAEVRSESATGAYLWLRRSLPETSCYRKLSGLGDAEVSISGALQDFGYRYPQRKARAIVIAGRFFCENEKSVGNWLKQSDPFVIRRAVVEGLWGVGPKIASHWLRNLGFDLPVIDIQVRRFLGCIGLVSSSMTAPTVSVADYLWLEAVFTRISEILGVPAGILDRMVWTHARRTCSLKKQRTCPLSRICQEAFQRHRT